MSNSNTPPASEAAAACVPGEHIFVAIPTLNEENHIEACIRSLMDGDDRLAAVKIFVADGGSTDKTVQIVESLKAEFPNLAVIHNPKRLQSAAVNLVAFDQEANGRSILVRCDAHAAYPPGYITKVADALVSRDADSLVVPMDAVGQSCFQKANAWIVDTKLGSGGSAHRGGRVSMFVDHGHHAGFKLDMFRMLGGYDESFSHNEDAEYDTRVQAAGGRIFLDATIRLEYHPRDRVSTLARQYFNYGKGRVRTLVKHKTRPRLRQLIPVANCLGLLGAVALSAVQPLFLIYPAFYLAVLGAASIAIALKHKSVCGLLAGVASFTMHNAWGAGFLWQLATGRQKR